jgi:hypothetical protein
MPQTFGFIERRHTKGPAYQSVVDQTDLKSPAVTETEFSSVKEGPNIPGWPGSPQELKTKWLTVCGEVALLAFPIAFLGLLTTPDLGCSS